MKNKKITIITILLVILFIVVGFEVNKVEAKTAYFSTDINGIDESKYPGYKKKIQELQKIYPNIQLLYTGLDWNTVIKNEYGVAGRNLVETTQEEEWRDGTELYDTGWYRASKEAVEYVIDPRNSLDTTNIFQFQKLNTTVGTSKDEIRKVLQMQKVIYLQNDESSIEAFTNVAKKNKLNAYHLITRVIQEQGRDGTSPLCSGKKYVGTDGNTYEGYYNLFNIGATGSGRANVITNGLIRAKQEGWTSMAASINGGGNFVGEDYIDVGQNTLYLQKFCVYNKNGSLYWHQYMTNLLAAKSEASILLKNYQITGAQQTKNFEFVIPVYENMPKDASPEPTGEYSGTINTELISIDSYKGNNGNDYIGGYAYIGEYINGNCGKPKRTPKITLKSTDGKISKEMYVNYEENIKYYFDIDISKLDTSKEYYIEVTLQGDKNIASESSKTQNLRLPSKTLNENFQGKTIKITNNKIVFSEGKYSGTINTTLNEIGLVQNARGEYYISGYVDIAEYIGEGNPGNTPKSMPEIRLKSTDGTVNIVTYIGYEKGITYYFDKIIQYLDVSKEYYLEARLTTEENIASEVSKTQKLRLGTQTIGKFNNITVNAKNDNFVLNYIGTINTELIKLNLIQNWKGENYISGYIYIAEWVNGECKTPYSIPTIKIKSTDGKFETTAYVGYEGGIKYYFDKCITDFDVSKEYIVEAVLTSKNNIATNEQKTQRIVIGNSDIGKNGTVTVTSKDNKIKISDSSLYEGTINTEINQIKVIQSGDKDYISGYIYVAEWVNGECKTPKEIPEIKLKARDGSYETKMYVGYEGGIKYYFDKYIGNLDTNKEYYMEVKLSGKKNIAPEESKKQEVRMKKDEEIGRKINGDKVVTEGNNIKIKADTYEGNINTELYKMQIIQNGAGQDYISGYIYVAEWVKGKCRTPREIPELSLKSTDGKFETKMYVGYEGGIKYYFDKYIGNLDTNKEYYIEVKLTGKNNIAPEINKTQTAKITPQGEIGRCKNGNIVQVKGNNIKIVKDTVQTLSIKQEERAIKPNKTEEQEKTNISSEEGKEKEQQENKTIEVENKEEETNEEIEKTKDNEKQQKNDTENININDDVE